MNGWQIVFLFMLLGPIVLSMDWERLSGPLFFIIVLGGLALELRYL
jgi:hypothetical protein